MTNLHYILDESHNPICQPDLHKWAVWFETHERHVAQEVIGDVRVSTVFLGLDHNFGDDETPILFETMIFGGEHDQYQERFATWDEAMVGHQIALDLVKGGTNDPL